MTIRFENSVFVHVPRTGGVWFRKATEDLPIRRQVLSGDFESHLPVWKLPFEFRTLTPFSFVRHPIPWIQSRWTHAIEYKTPVRHVFFGIHRVFDELVRPTLQETIQCVLKNRPGVFGETLEFMYQNWPKKCILRRTEDLPVAASELLQQLEGISEDQVRSIHNIGKFNSTVEISHWENSPLLTVEDSLLEEYLASEAKALQIWESAKGE